MIEFLNTNSGIMMFIVTLFYAVISSLMWNEMRKSRVKHDTPDISINLIQKEATNYEIEISNQSNSEIYDLTFNVIPKLEKTFPKGTENIGFLKNGISYMCKGQKYRSSFINTINHIDQIDDENETHFLVFKYKLYDKPISCKNRKEFQKKIKINLSLIANTATSPIFEVGLVKQLKELNKNFKKYIEKKS
jgi:hypothetical protein